MDLFVAEAKAVRIPQDFVIRACKLRTTMSRLRSQIQRDGFVLEQLSLKTKTPYVQFTLTKRLSAQGAEAASPPAGGAETSAGGGGGVTSALADANKEPTSRPPM